MYNSAVFPDHWMRSQQAKGHNALGVNNDAATFVTSDYGQCGNHGGEVCSLLYLVLSIQPSTQRVTEMG
jgi:hypothetical protein